MKATTSSGTLTVALEYAERYDWHLLRVDGKRPIEPRGLKSATADPDVIRVRWTETPDAGIAVACRPSGLLVIDVDERHGGWDQLHDLEGELGVLPDTPTSLTGGGGAHALFANPRVRTGSRLAAGVDIRDKAYIVLPRSRHESGRTYEWEHGPDELPVAQLPPAWLERIARKESEKLCRQPGPIPDDRRNDTLTSIAGAMRRAGLGAVAIEAALTVANKERCRPPLPSAEVRKISRSIGKGSSGPLWALDPLEFVNSAGELTPAERLVLVALCHRANDQGRVIGGAWIETETGLSKRTVIRATQALEGQERISVRRRKNRPNIYTLTVL